MNFVNLPVQCKDCKHLRSGGIHMNGDAEFACKKVPVFLKNKQPECPEFCHFNEPESLKR